MDRHKLRAKWAPLCDCKRGEDSDLHELCGCGEPHIRTYRDPIYHYGGQHWDDTCLIAHLGGLVETLVDACQTARQANETLTRRDFPHGDAARALRAMLDAVIAKARGSEVRSL